MTTYNATKFRNGLMSGSDKSKLDELNPSLTAEAPLSQIAGLEPTLDLQFNDPSVVSQGITFARNSVGSYYGYDGILRYAAANEARIDYNPETEELKGLLIEEARQNLLTNTENFDNASWTKARSSIGVDSAVAPDGTMTADKLIEDTQTGFHYVLANNVSVSSNTTYTFSCYLKAGERNWAYVKFAEGNDTSYYSTYVNLSDGSFGAIVTAGSPTATDRKIESVGNGWYRVSVTANVGAFSTGDAVCTTATGDGVSSYTGDGKSGIYVWGAQLEAGSFPTSYVPSAQTFNGRSLFTNIAYASKSYEPNTPTTTVGTGLAGITFKPDGTKMYLSTATGDAVYQYSLGTAWDVSTTTYDTKSFTESVTGVSYAIRLNNDGTKAFRVYDNGASSVVREYTLSVAYDISTMTYASVSYSLAATMTVPRGLEFSADGLFMYVSDATTDKIYRYTLGSAWSLSSVTASGELSVATQEATVNGIAFDSTGKNLILTGVTSDFIQIYTLGTAWDITTAKFTGQTFSATAGGLESQPSGLYLRPDNSNIYVAGITTDDVFQYTCTLASDVSSYYNSTGTLVKSTDIAFARNSYNPSPDKLHLAPKLLLEPQATNLCLQSEDFSTTWVSSGTTVTVNNVASPDGTTTADKLENSGAAAGEVYQDITTVAAGIYTFSCFVKAGDVSSVTLQNMQVSGTVDKAKVSFDLATKAITEVTATNLVGRGIQELPNGWFRIWISSKAEDTSTRFKVINNSIVIAKYIYVWGGQIAGASSYGPTSYIPTTTASVTRSADFYTSASVTRQADNASMTGSNFTSWYRFDEGTFYCESESSGKVVSGVQRVGASVAIENLNDSTSRIYIGQIVGLGSRGTVEANGAAVAVSTGTAYVANTFEKMSLAFATNNTAGSVSGGSPTTDTSCQIPSFLNQMSIGNISTAGRELNGHIKRLTFWPMRLSNDVLQKLTSKETSFLAPLATKYRAGLMNTRDKALVDSMNTGVSFDSVGKATFTNDVVVSGELVTSKSQLTVAAGVVTANKSYHTIAGENGVADDLVTINGGVDGMRLLIRAVSDTVTITVKHNTGNIFLNGTDFVMDNQYDLLELIYDATLSKWIEMARANNGA